MGIIKAIAKGTGQQLVRPYTEVVKSAGSLGSSTAQAVRDARRIFKQAGPQPLDQVARDGMDIADPKARFEFHATARQRSNTWIEKQLKQVRIGHAGTLWLALTCTATAVAAPIASPTAWGASMAFFFSFGAALAGIRCVLFSIQAFQLRHRALVGFRSVPLLAHLEPWSER